MPLTNTMAPVEIKFAGVLPDGTPYEDAYELKASLGFYDSTELKLAGMSISDMRSIFDQAKQGDNGDTSEPESVIEKISQDQPRSPAEIVAIRNQYRLHAWLISWSHSEPLTLENVRYIPEEQADVLLDEIERLEGAQETPFRRKSGTEGVYHQHRPGKSSPELDNVHEEGTREKG